MDYLAIIRKADFVDLFKYGKLNVYSAIDFDGNIKYHANDNDLFEKLTRNMNLFEYSFEYMVIHFISDNGNEYPYPISIKDVRGIYTFNEEAQKEMSVSSETDRKMCESIITDDVVSEVFDELFSYKRPTGEQSIWTYLLRYERHSFYPKNTKGYFCDYIHVACNWMAKKEMQNDVAIETTLYNLIKESPATDFKPLSQIAINSNLPSRTDEVAKCQFAVAAPLFLLLKDKFSSGFYIDSKTIDYAKTFGFECSVAIYLLGLTLGYDKTYDAYYDCIKLPIFKEKVQSEYEDTEEFNEDLPSMKSKKEFNLCNMLKNNQEQLGIVASDSSVPQNQLFEFENKAVKGWMRYSRNKKYDIKPVFTDTDIQILENKGYIMVKKLTQRDKETIKNQGYEIF